MHKFWQMVSTHDAHTSAVMMSTKENSVESEAMQGGSCFNHVCNANVTAGCRWMINETFVRQSNACMSGMRMVYLPSAAYPDVKHV